MSFVKIVASAECADIWYKLKKDDKEKHIHVMKVYLLSPFLFGIVHQDDKVNKFIPMIILLHEKFLQFDWLRAVLFQLCLK